MTLIVLIAPIFCKLKDNFVVKFKPANQSSGSWIGKYAHNGLHFVFSTDEASGSSMDWVKGYLGTQYAYGMELRPTQNVRNGFITTTDSIQPATQDVWEGLKVVVQRAATDLRRATAIG